MRLGVLGGTFDPPHAGHLRMARLAQRQLGLDGVMFIPCAAQPLKGRPPLTSPYHRAAMLALAVGVREAWSLELRELERGGLSYTVDTLEGLHREHPGAELFLIVGGDSLGTFRRWRRAERILALAKLAVIPRAGEGTRIPSWGVGRVHILRAAELSVSSTQVRGLLSQGKDVTGLVPRAVVRYIERQGLYAPPRGRRQRRTS